MKITVKLFAIGRDLVGKNEVDLTLPEDAIIQHALDQLCVDYPNFSKLTTFMIAINMEYADKNTRLNDGDELAIIPPVSGG